MKAPGNKARIGRDLLDLQPRDLHACRDAERQQVAGAGHGARRGCTNGPRATN